MLTAFDSITFEAELTSEDAEREIADAVGNGAATMAHLEDTLLIGTCCGKCRDKASECLERFRPAWLQPGLAMSA